jgi:NADPH-dependent curcumin reductase CurA
MTLRNRQWLLARRPRVVAEEADFQLVEAEVPALAKGQLLVRVHFLSLDPYMRGRMDEAKSYAPPQPLGQVMIGATVGEVVDSKHPGFQPGESVVGNGGWQEYFVSDGGGLRKVDTSAVPASAWLGAVGMPGVTAWYGLNHIGKPRPAETVLVSAASGAVGGVVGQLARMRGCRVVGVAGGSAKCDYVVGELGFHACVDYKTPEFQEAFQAATPDGIDFDFENVGGKVFDAALSRMNAFGRVALCGLIAGYGGGDLTLHNVRAILVRRLRIEGFIVSEHLDLWPQALRELAEMVAQGKLKYRESIAEGIESAPRAFLAMLRGGNFGKQLVRM